MAALCVPPTPAEANIAPVCGGFARLRVPPGSANIWDFSKHIVGLSEGLHDAAVLVSRSTAHLAALCVPLTPNAVRFAPLYGSRVHSRVPQPHPLAWLYQILMPAC